MRTEDRERLSRNSTTNTPKTLRPCDSADMEHTGRENTRLNYPTGKAGLCGFKRVLHGADHRLEPYSPLSRLLFRIVACQNHQEPKLMLPTMRNTV